MTRTNGRFLILLLGFAAYSGLFVASLASGIPLGTVLICERQLIYPNPPICAAVRSGDARAKRNDHVCDRRSSSLESNSQRTRPLMRRRGAAYCKRFLLLERRLYFDGQK